MAKKITTNAYGVGQSAQGTQSALPADTAPDTASETVDGTGPSANDAGAQTPTPVKTEGPEIPMAGTEAPTPEVPAPKTGKKPEAEKPAGTIPEHIDRILKVNSTYAQLYIDPHGGTFTVNTPPAFRSTATLYTNPYYKRP
jgi:hypothetical protein